MHQRTQPVDPRPFFIERGSTVRVRQRAFGFLLLRGCFRCLDRRRWAARANHAVANSWKIAVAVVDEGGLLVALGRMDGAFPLSAQIAEAKAAGTALWHRDGEELAASRASHEGFFDAVSGLVRLPLIPGPGSVLIWSGGVVLGAAGASGASGDDDRACVDAGLRAVFPG
jgi:glc operon protein GlcG